MHLSDADHVWAETHDYLDEDFRREVAVDDIVKARLLGAVCLLMAYEQICDAIKQEDDVEHQ